MYTLFARKPSILPGIKDLCLEMSSNFTYYFESVDMEVFRLEHTIKSLTMTDKSYLSWKSSRKKLPLKFYFCSEISSGSKYCWLCTGGILPDYAGTVV